jgi:pSer/pThr/pTyr-binding forkhead associated (FHA) protein
MELGRLQVTYQEGQQQEISLVKDGFAIGGAPDNDLVLNDRTVSKHHARLTRSSGAWKLIDLGSANGTYVDGQRLLTLELHSLQDGSSIRIGATHLVLRLAAAAPASPDEAALLEEMKSFLATTPAPSPPPAAPPPPAVLSAEPEPAPPPAPAVLSSQSLRRRRRNHQRTS